MTFENDSTLIENFFTLFKLDHFKLSKHNEFTGYIKQLDTITFFNNQALIKITGTLNLIFNRFIIFTLFT